MQEEHKPQPIPVMDLMLALRSIRNTIGDLELRVVASAFAGRAGGAVEAHLSTAYDSVAAALSSSMEIIVTAAPDVTDADRATAQDGRA